MSQQMIIIIYNSLSFLLLPGICINSNTILIEFKKNEQQSGNM